MWDNSPLQRLFVKAGRVAHGAGRGLQLVARRLKKPLRGGEAPSERVPPDFQLELRYLHTACLWLDNERYELKNIFALPLSQLLRVATVCTIHL